MNLEIQQVGKQYRGGKVALSNFSLTLQPGVHGLLGPNGAGKSAAAILTGAFFVSALALALGALSRSPRHG